MAKLAPRTVTEAQAQAWILACRRKVLEEADRIEEEQNPSHRYMFVGGMLVGVRAMAIVLLESMGWETEWLINDDESWTWKEPKSGDHRGGVPGDGH